MRILREDHYRTRLTRSWAVVQALTCAFLRSRWRSHDAVDGIGEYWAGFIAMLVFLAMIVVAYQ